MDNGTIGCEGSHRNTWSYLSTQDGEYGLVLEDDAVPVEGFRDQLDQALQVAPTPIISFYLGQGRPPQWQARINQAIHAAEQDNACWITGRRLLHGVAVCVRTDLIPSMLTHLKASTRPIDFAIKDWAVQAGHDISFTVPSLCNHADGPTVITDRTDSVRNEKRTAWRCGTRDTWNSRSVPL